MRTDVRTHLQHDLHVWSKHQRIRLHSCELPVNVDPHSFSITSIEAEQILRSKRTPPQQEDVTQRALRIMREYEPRIRTSVDRVRAVGSLDSRVAKRRMSESKSGRYQDAASLSEYFDVHLKGRG
jgi:hypothetical protein